MAASYAEHPQEAGTPSLRSDREACDIADVSFDRSVRESITDGRGNVHIPGAKRLMSIFDNALEAMLAPIGLWESAFDERLRLHKRYRERLDRLVKARPPIVDEMLSNSVIAEMSSGRPVSSDGFHLLIMDLHKELTRLQNEMSTEEVDGARAYAITDCDRPLIAAFMRGVGRTAPLKFEHPGLATTAARSGDTLLIQNDLGTTAAHVLVVRVTGTAVLVTHTDIHLQRLRFLQSLLEGTGLQWDDLVSRQSSAIAENDLFYVARGRYEAPDFSSLAAFLERLGSRLVFSDRLEPCAQEIKTTGSQRTGCKDPAMGRRT
jgi:hypothetical protein